MQKCPTSFVKGTQGMSLNMSDKNPVLHVQVVQLNFYTL